MFGIEVDAFRLAKDWIPSLASQLRKIRSSRIEELSELSDTFGDPRMLAESYVQPDCQQVSPGDYPEDEDHHIVREPAFSRLEAFLSGSYNRKTRHMLILSDAGMGKTSLLVMLKLAHLNSFWPKPYRCELLKLGHDTLGAINALPKKKDTILLLDGLDEDKSAWDDRNAYLRQLFASTEPFRRTIITCRNQFINLAQDPFERKGLSTVLNWTCVTVYLSYFTSRQVAEYVSTRYSDHLLDQNWINRASSILSGMKTLKFRPLLLAHLEDLVDSGRALWGEFSIYRSLVSAWLLREHKKLVELFGPVADIESLWAACRQLAYLIHSTGSGRISQEQLERYATERHELRTLTAAQLGVRSLLNRDTSGNYLFSHYSILEFLVVDGLLCGQIIDPSIRVTSAMKSFLSDIIKSGEYKNVDIQLLRQIGLQGIDLRKCNLDCIDLSGFDCKDADFSFSSMRGAILTGTDLSAAMLDGADMTNATMDRASLAWVKARGCAFVGANLRRAELKYGLFGNSNFTAAKISAEDQSIRSADFSGVDLCESIIENTDFMECNFEKSRATRTKWTNCILKSCDLKEIDWAHCLFVGVVFVESPLIPKSHIAGASMNSLSMLTSTKHSWISESADKCAESGRQRYSLATDGSRTPYPEWVAQTGVAASSLSKLKPRGA